MFPQKCDEAISDFKSFLAEDLSKYATEVLGFSAEKDRLDNFYFSAIQISKYQQLLFAVKLMLTLSHVQMLVERGFSFDDNILKTNTGPEIVIAKRLIIEHMVGDNLKSRTIEITKPMFKAFRSVYCSYKFK